MKNKISKIKRFLSLALIFLFSINSFAAIVSDNDGSAFVTKAEFDALKEDFGKQIDDYNTSIDGKIDGAIASYLAGIQLITTERKNIYYSNWEKVTLLNYDIGNNWQYPDVNLLHQVNQWSPTGVYSSWQQASWVYINLIKNRSSSIQSKRMLVEAGPETATAPTFVTWKGRALDYLDKITISNVIELKAKTQNNGWFYGANDGRIYGVYLTKLLSGSYGVPASGYSSAEEYFAKNSWGPQFYYYDGLGGGHWYSYITSYFTYAAANTITLRNVSGKTTDYDHILHYDKLDNLWVSDVDWIWTLGNIKDSSFTRNGLLTACSKTGQYSIQEGLVDSRGKMRLLATFSGYYSGANGASDNTAMVSVGLIPSSYDSEHIYQDDNVPELTVDKKIYIETVKPNLCNGFLCFAANKGDNIKWEQKFIDYKVDGTTKSSIDLNVYMSLGKFSSSGTSLETGSEIIKSKGQVADYQATNSSGLVIWDFAMPNDGIVYCKWEPSDSIDKTKKWEATLDITSCGEYSYTKREE